MPVNIQGTPYKKVVERLGEFHADHKENKSIITEIIQFIDWIVVIKAAVKIGDDVFTGHAYEEIGSSQVNQNSALENGETSAIGRALASAGYAGSEFASADEMENALHKKQNAPSKAKKVDLSGDGWRDEKIGYKKEEKNNLTWRTAPDEDLIWIISDKCSVDKWKEPAKEEMNLRAAKVEEGTSPTVSKEEADRFFE